MLLFISLSTCVGGCRGGSYRFGPCYLWNFPEILFIFLGSGFFFCSVGDVCFSRFPCVSFVCLLVLELCLLLSFVLFPYFLVSRKVWCFSSSVGVAAGILIYFVGVVVLSEGTRALSVKEYCFLGLARQAHPLNFGAGLKIRIHYYGTKTLFKLPPTTILYMPCDVMMSIATALRYYASQMVRY
jgi:hypothetical protein